jgi:hypothetical protein
MNIFWLHGDVGACAHMACDQHVVKMVTEHTQLLTSALYHYGFKPLSMRVSHANHPCAVWARADFANFVALYCLNEAYAMEYATRYGKVHSSYLTMVYDVAYHGWSDIRQAFTDAGADANRMSMRRMFRHPTLYATIPPQAVPEPYKREAKSIDDLIRVYRRAYCDTKAEFARYLHSGPPDWLSPFLNLLV